MADAAAQMQFPPVPPLLVETFNWESSKTDASIRQRRANGSEAIVGIKKSNEAGAHDLYLISNVQFTDSGLVLSQLQEKVERALVKLRYEHPEIAQTAWWEEGQITPWLQYQPPKSTEDALAWAHERVHIRASSQTGLDIRSEIETKRLQEGSSGGPATSFTIDIAAPVAGLDAALGDVNVEFVFHANHLYFDGISKRIFVGDFFRYLGKEVSLTGELPEFKWGEETKNLADPMLTLLKDSAQITGPEYDRVLGEYFAIAMKGANNYGLKANTGVGVPRVIFHTFTKEESEAIYNAVKSKIGPSASPTHLGNAAVFLSLMKANPPSADGEIYASHSAINGRRWLKDSLDGKTHYPVTVATCPVLYENLKQYKVIDASKETIDEYLVQTTKIAQECYEKWLSNPITLPVVTTLFNFTAMMATADFGDKPVTAPLFASDGVNETYIDREVTDETGNISIKINTVRFFLNQYLHFISVRLDSFRDHSELSLSYNDGHYTEKEASDFLQDTVSFMLQFAQ